eukprot:12226166-Alexandrium_andersonii.AAC.1
MHLPLAATARISHECLRAEHVSTPLGHIAELVEEVAPTIPIKVEGPRRRRTWQHDSLLHLSLIHISEPTRLALI